MIDIENLQRTVQVAIAQKPMPDGGFEDVATITARSLVAMKDGDWGFWRDRAVDHANNSAQGIKLSCFQCGEPLFVRARRTGKVNLPLFSHHAGSIVPCSWNSGQTLSPDQARALQYGGRQESALHKRLCKHIEQSAKSDSRHVTSTVNEYRKPEHHSFGRYPDVFVEWRDFGSFAFEVQISKTLITEISSREMHYDAEGVRLLWLFFGVDPRREALPQSMVDIVRRHRNNAFFIDQSSIQSSIDKKTIVLSFYLRNENGTFDNPVLVALDDLTYPPRGLPYLEDRITSELVSRAQEARTRWIRSLSALEPDWRRQRRVPESLKPEINALKAEIGSLSNFDEPYDEGFALLVLIAFCFTIAAHANGKNISYVTRQMNISAIINTMLQHEAIGVQRYVNIIDAMINKTSLKDKLPNSVKVHIDRAYKNMDGNLCLDFEPEHTVISSLIPEIFDETVREQMIYLDSLPSWARSS